MPAPPAELVEQMIAAGQATALSQRAPKPWVWKALATCGVAGIAILVALPRSSSAAVTLDRLVDAHKRSDVLFHVTPYWVEGKTRTPKIWAGYVKGDRWHYIQSDYEMASDGKHIMTYLPHRGRAQVWTADASEIDPKNVLGGADLSWWRSSERKGVSLKHNVSWNGRLVDRYEVTTYSETWGPSTNILYADPIEDRPLYSESIHESGNGSAMEWDYPNPPDEAVLEIKMKSGTRIEDVTTQRAQAKRGNEAPQKAEGGR